MHDACQDGKTTGELVGRVSEAELSSGGANRLREPSTPRRDPQSLGHSTSCCGLNRIHQGMPVLISKRSVETSGLVPVLRLTGRRNRQTIINEKRKNRNQYFHKTSGE